MDVDNHHTLNALREGSEEALESIFERFKHPLLHFANAIVKDLPFSEEIVSDSFVKLWGRRRDFESEQKIKAFLFVATKNSCLTYLKSFHGSKMRATDQISEDSLIEDPKVYQSLIRSEALAILSKEIENLSPIQRKIIQMSHFEEQEPKEISRKLNMLPNAVYVNYSRAIQNLRKKLLQKKDWLF